MVQTKKKNLAAALAEPATTAPVEEAPKAAASASNDRTSTPRKGRASREGQTNIAAWFPMAVKFQLDELRVQLSRKRGKKVTLGQLQAEAYNDIFKKYGMAEIAPGAED